MTDLVASYDSWWLRLIIGFLLGLILGSFSTMLSYRLPRRLSITMPRSHCISCKTPLGTLDLIPLFSWIFTQGKCRHCGTPASIRYPLIEFCTAIASATALCIVGFSSQLVGLLALIVAIVTIVTIWVER